jgi:hypothetical protein
MNSDAAQTVHATIIQYICVALSIVALLILPYLFLCDVVPKRDLLVCLGLAAVCIVHY